jgi:PadR family transcriptional regulator PadR
MVVQLTEAPMQEEIERWAKELKKGATKFSILAILRDGDMYGYELRREFETRTGGFMALTEGNAYPTLHGMEGDGLITSYWKDSGSGLPSRKYYHLTEKGEMLLNERKPEWKLYTEAMNGIWRKDNGGDKN